MLAKNDTALVIVDTNAFLHSVNYRIRDWNMMPQILKFNFVYLCSGAYLEKFNEQKIQIIFANDLKPYWRLPHLYKYLGVNYKLGRGKDSMRDEKITALREELQELFIKVNKLSVRQYATKKIDGMSVGYEADDIAAGIVKTLSPNYKHTYLLTDDADWLPMTSSTVTWCGIAHYKPRVRTPEIALDWAKNHKNHQTKLKKTFKWESHMDIWKFKCLYGDISDGLTGDKNDSTIYRPYIDLFNPVDEFRVWDEPCFHEKINYALFPSISVVSYQTILKKSGGLPLFMPGYHTEEEIEAFN